MTDDLPACSWTGCRSRARWAVADTETVVRWHACGRHLSGVLAIGRWEADYVRVYDLNDPAGAA